MTRMQKMVLLLCLLLVAVPLFSGCAPKAPVEETRDYFKVGVVTELTGDLTYGGHITKRGYDAWAQKVNEQGGIEIGGKRYPVQMFYGDAQSDPSVGADAAERLITEVKVDFLLGPYSSSVTLGTAPITDKYGYPFITGSAESPLIWLQKFKYTFGTVPAVNRILVGGAINTLFKEISPAPQSIFIVGTDDAFSKSGAEATKAYAEKNGITVAGFEIVPRGIDYMSIIAKAKAANPDVYLVSAHIIDHLENVKAAKEANFNPKAFVFHYGLTASDFYEALGADAEGMFGASVWTPELDFPCPLFGNTAGYVEYYEKLYGSVPDYTAAGSTAAGMAFGEALKKIGATPPLNASQREALMKALEQIQLMTFYGMIDFATEGDFFHNNMGLNNLAMQIQNGVPVIVGPKDVKFADPIYPQQPWR